MVANPLLDQLLERLSHLLGPKGFTRDPTDLAPWLEDWRKRYKGAAPAMLSPPGTDELDEIVRLCRAARVPLVTQGGNS